MQGNGDQALGIYISIPFCRSKCTYCNFASGVYPASAHERYIDRLIADLKQSRPWAAEAGATLPSRVDTVYLGGGTPSLLAPELVTALFAALRSEFALDPNAEITAECAPGQLADATLQAFLAAGVNRISLGVQSFVDREARQSGRLHTHAQVLSDVARLRAAGIANLNLDLIAGLATQTLESWRLSLDALLACDSPHASVYMLEVDEDSRLGREVLAGGARYFAPDVPADVAIVAMYESAIEALGAAGLAQYEISNFARPGAESRHNLRYWDRRPYLGLGLDGSSMLRASAGEHAENILRAATTASLEDYLNAAPPVEMEWLNRDRQLEEAWFLGLRKNSGVSPASLTAEFGDSSLAPSLAVASQLVEDGLLRVEGERFRLTPHGRLISNDVFERFLGLECVSPR